MSDNTGITWADSTYNPVTGCSPISEGCQHCFARTMAKRLQAMGSPGYEYGFEVTLHPERLDEPAHWRKPRRVFCVSMGDLFHEEVPGEFINRVWMSAFNAPRHTYLFLTKRPARLLEWTRRKAAATQWPIEDIWPDWMWLGVTAENQARADERIPILLDTPAAHRWISMEPLLGPVDLRPWLSRLGWVVVGGESGPGYRPMNLDWVRDLRDQCAAARVPFHFKQFDGVRPAKLPELDGVVHDAVPPFGERA